MCWDSKLSEHFTWAELNVADAEERIQQNAEFLAQTLLEPMRAQWGPLRITSGYRSRLHNSAVGGEPGSWHLCAGGEAAADVQSLGVMLRIDPAYPTAIEAIFDWLRLQSALPFDKVILEVDADGKPEIVHVQVARDVGEPVEPRRLAYRGSTHNVDPATGKRKKGVLLKGLVQTISLHDAHACEFGRL